MSWFEKSSSKKIAGITIATGETLQIALYQIQSQGDPQLIGKEEFVIKTTPLSERKRLVHSFISRYGRRIQFQHILMRDRAFTKQFQFPSQNMAEIKQMLALRLPREIPSAIDQIVYHFHPVEHIGKENVQTEILLFGVSKDLVNQERELLKSFGIIPQKIVLSTIVLASFVQKKLGGSSGFPRIVLYGAHGKGEVILVNDRGVIFSRSFTYDSADAIHSLQDAIDPIFEALEKKEEISAYDLCVSGDIEKMKGQLFIGRYPNRVSLHPKELTLSPMNFLLFAGANIYGDDDRFNLLPEEVKQKIAVAKSETHFAELRFALALTLIVFLIVFFATSIRTAIALSAVNQKLVDLEPSVREIKDISRSAQLLNKIKAQKILPLEILAVAHEKSAGSVSLAEFEYDEKEGSVHLKGRTDSQALVDQYVRALSDVEWFSGVELQYSESTSDGVRSQFQFSINAILKNGSDK